MSTDGYLILDSRRYESRPLLYWRHVGRATSRSKHSWEISGAELYGGSSIALNSLEGLRARIDLKQVITCTTISRNLLVARAARGQRPGRLAQPDSSSTTTEETRTPSRSSTTSSRRGGTATRLRHDDRHHIPSIPASCIRYPCARGTTSGRDPRLAHFNETKIKASIAAGAKFGEHKTSADTATKKLTHLCRGRVEGKAHDIPKHRQSERTDRVGGALVHTDIKTDVPTPSYRGDKYFIHFTDDKTRHTRAVRIAEEERFRKRTSANTIYIRGHRLLSVELATSSDNTISGVDNHTASGTVALVEGGGGDGLDEVDKFIHDALNQAPPTEGGASPIEGGGEPDLGALGIHGHARTDGQRPGVQAHHADNRRPHLRSLQPCTSEIVRPYSTQTRHSSITLVIPDWESVIVDQPGIPLRHSSQEKRYTVTQMASHAARRDGMSRFTDSADPHMTDLLLPSSAGTLV
ncbi:hypothetical protein RI054_22g97300 [Pseudoscourfieldia marina]